MAKISKLLVEGTDDEHVVKAICGRRNLSRIDQIVNTGGIEKLLLSLPLHLQTSDISALGILVDADINLASRWESIRNHLEKAGYTTPDDPKPCGLIIEPPADTLLPTVGVWLMPNNSATGILEDFLEYLVPTSSTKLFDYAAKSVAAIPQPDFSELSKSKAIIHTFLAWQKEPGRPLGQAITANFLDHNAAIVDSFTKWLTTLFNLRITPA